MLRLLQFEIQKKWKMSLGVLAAYFIVFMGLYFKFKADGFLSLEEFGFQLVLFIVLGAALFVFSMIGAVNNLRIEAKSSTRDLYFSIPMTAYTKIGSKVIVSLVEVFGALAIAFFSITKVVGALTETEILSDMLKEIDLTFGDWAFVLSSQLVRSTIALLIVYLSFALFRTFFSQVKLGWLITIIIYIGLNVAYLMGLNKISQNIELTDTTQYVILAGFTVFAAAMFALIGYLFENKVSFD